MVQHWDREEWEVALEENALVAVDFWADWCMPCRMMAPVVDQLAEEYEGKVAVGKINVDEQRELAIEYGVQSIPTVIFFKDGEVAEEVVGVRPYEELQQIVEGLL